jgi:hypothetical protein
VTKRDKALKAFLSVFNLCSAFLIVLKHSQA